MATTLSNASPHKPEIGLGLEFKTPHAHRMDRSLGSIPLLTYKELQPQTPADVVPIEKVRLIQARASYKAPKVDVNLCPYELGVNAQMAGKGKRANPFSKTEEPEPHAEWLDGFYTEW